MTTKTNGSTIGKLRSDLEYELTYILAALEHNEVAGDLEDDDIRDMRKRVVQIDNQLATWRR